MSSWVNAILSAVFAAVPLLIAHLGIVRGVLSRRIAIALVSAGGAFGGGLFVYCLGGDIMGGIFVGLSSAIGFGIGAAFALPHRKHAE